MTNHPTTKITDHVAVTVEHGFGDSYVVTFPGGHREHWPSSDVRAAGLALPERMIDVHVRLPEGIAREYALGTLVADAALVEGCRRAIENQDLLDNVRAREVNES